MEGTRHAAVTQLIALASSVDYRDRAAAGRALAVFADVRQAREPLLALVLDTADTFVTRVTAEALLRRQDLAGYAVVARALAVADDNHADWIKTAIIDVFVVYGGERDAAVGECEALLDDEDDQVRQGARLLRAALTAITPVLFSPRPAADQP